MSVRQSSSLHWASVFFKWSKKIRNLNKTIGHCHFVQKIPSVPEMISQTQSDHSPLSYGDFFSKMIRLIFDNISPGFSGSLFYTVKHIRLHIGRTFSLLVSPSVRPSEFAILFSTVPGLRLVFSTPCLS